MQRTTLRAAVFVFVAVVLRGQDALAQEPTVPDYESRFVEANGVDGWAEYHDFMFHHMRKFLQSLPSLEANR